MQNEERVGYHLLLQHNKETREPGYTHSLTSEHLDETSLGPLRGPGWTGNRVLLGSTPQARDTTVAWVCCSKGWFVKKKIEMVLRDPESIFFTFSFVFIDVSKPFSLVEIVHFRQQVWLVNGSSDTCFADAGGIA